MLFAVPLTLFLALLLDRLDSLPLLRQPVRLLNLLGAYSLELYLIHVLVFAGAHLAAADLDPNTTLGRFAHANLFEIALIALAVLLAYPLNRTAGIAQQCAHRLIAPLRSSAGSQKKRRPTS